MRVRVENQQLTFFKYLSDEFHSWALKKLLKSGEIWAKFKNGIVLEIADNSFMGQLLRTIDSFVDKNGADAIETLNSLNWRTIRSLDIFYDQSIQRAIEPKKYAKHLVTLKGEVQDSEVLMTSHSFNEVCRFAADYLKKVNFAKRIKIIYQINSERYVVCIRS